MYACLSALRSRCSKALVRISGFSGKQRRASTATDERSRSDGNSTMYAALLKSGGVSSSSRDDANRQARSPLDDAKLVLLHEEEVCGEEDECVEVVR